ncbi:hypothetical protein Esti_000368 [Eimeria stiedai]
MSSPAAPMEADEALLPTLPAAAALPGKQKAAGKRASTQKQPVRTKKAKPDSTASNDTTPPKDLVLAYMRQQNRPYNSQLIFDNLKRAIKKPALEGLLEELVTEEYLIAKDLGKTRDGRDNDIDSITPAHSAEAELAAKRENPQEDSKAVSATAAAAAEHLHAKLHAAWATQKRRCHQLVQLLAERTQTDDSQLQEELGLERDEDFIPLTAYASY